MRIPFLADYMHQENAWMDETCMLQLVNDIVKPHWNCTSWDHPCPTSGFIQVPHDELYCWSNQWQEYRLSTLLEAVLDYDCLLVWVSRNPSREKCTKCGRSGWWKVGWMKRLHKWTRHIGKTLPIRLARLIGMCHPMWLSIHGDMHLTTGFTKIKLIYCGLHEEKINLFTVDKIPL